jgi:hypothetical protein
VEDTFFSCRKQRTLDFISPKIRHIKKGNGGDGSGDRSTGADG